MGHGAVARPHPAELGCARLHEGAPDAGGRPPDGPSAAFATSPRFPDCLLVRILRGRLLSGQRVFFATILRRSVLRAEVTPLLEKLDAQRRPGLTERDARPPHPAAGSNGLRSRTTLRGQQPDEPSDAIPHHTPRGFRVRVHLHRHTATGWARRARRLALTSTASEHRQGAPSTWTAASWHESSSPS